MGLSQTRKIISVIASLATAIACALFIFSAVGGTMLTSSSILKKTMITDSLASQCEKQLDAKYKTLEGETGIPQRVFLQVKTTYGTKNSLKRALTDIFISEDATLYTEQLETYFNKLCTEYLDGSNIKYSKKDVNLTAKKAAKIYCDTFGIHNAEYSLIKIEYLKSKSSTVRLLSIFVILLCALIVAVIYKNKKKGLSYWLSGLSGGALGASFAAALGLIFKVYTGFNLKPEVFSAAVGHSVKIAFACILALGIVFAIIMYILFYIVYNKSQNTEE